MLGVGGGATIAEAQQFFTIGKRRGYGFSRTDHVFETSSQQLFHGGY